MKNVVSISLGSKLRDHETTTTILGEKIRIRRIGVDGDFKRARALFLELDDEVDAFGMGGCEFGINFDGRYYRLRSVAPLVEGINSPVVDGSGIRGVVERSMGKFLCQNLTGAIGDKQVLCCVASARFDMVKGFHESGFAVKFGDPGFILGLPIGSQNYRLAQFAGRVFIPLVVRAPFHWLYPTGKKQLLNRPKFESWFNWADVIADDFHYIKRHLPQRIDGKIIVTNTTTKSDLNMLQERGAKYLVTSTPKLEGRTFGTNVFEAMMTAAIGLNRPLEGNEISLAIEQLGFQPEITSLN